LDSELKQLITKIKLLRNYYDVPCAKHHTSVTKKTKAASFKQQGIVSCDTAILTTLAV